MVLTSHSAGDLLARERVQSVPGQSVDGCAAPACMRVTRKEYTLKSQIDGHPDALIVEV